MNRTKLSWATFLDKVYGCWLGKCISGTIGAPYEGFKGDLKVTYSPKLIENMLPNDDLDLQILWLEVLEEKGAAFTSADLAKAFYEKCPYAPGEYATFKKNYELGLQPPLTGKFNNNYYIEGMGCPIRSEIWACVAPGDPALAAELSAKDGCMDHCGESIIAERYLAALEAMAFLWEGSIHDLILAALDHVPANSKYRRLVTDVVGWCDSGADAATVMGRILRNYGHSDCTNMYQNMGISLLALLLGAEDMLDTTILALNCGFDTDCTCATVGSIIGILRGGDSLVQQYAFPEQTYILSVNTTRRSDKVYDLAVDTARAALLFADANAAVELTDLPEDAIAPASGAAYTNTAPLAVTVCYPEDDPTIAPGESKAVTLHICGEKGLSGSIRVTAPEGFAAAADSAFALEDGCAALTVTVTADTGSTVLMNRNLFTADFTLADGRTQQVTFGIVGAQLWRVYGPLWKNVHYAPPLAGGESYYNWIPGGSTPEQGMTNTRQFHLNMAAPWKESVCENELLAAEELPAVLANGCEGFAAAIRRDLFGMEDLFGFHGPCVAYLVRELIAPEDMTACIQIGHSDQFRLWLNGSLLAEADNTENWTPENIHKLHVPLKAGKNRLVLKLCRTNLCSDFSIMFTKNGGCTDMLSCLGSAVV